MQKQRLKAVVRARAGSVPSVDLLRRVYDSIYWLTVPQRYFTPLTIEVTVKTTVGLD